MKSLIPQRKYRAVVTLIGTLVISAFIIGACATTAVQNNNGDVGHAVANPPDKTEPFYANKPLPKGPAIVEGYSSPAAQQQDPNTYKELVNETKNTTKSISRGMLDLFIRKGPQHALKLLTVSPAFQGNRFIGYEVLGFTNKGVSLSGALKPGDIITTVNNRNIVRPEDYMAAWESLKSCDTVQVKLIRKGETVEMKWSVTQTHKK